MQFSIVVARKLNSVVPCFPLVLFGIKPMTFFLPHTLRRCMRTVARYKGNCRCSRYPLYLVTGTARNGAWG